MYRIFIDGRAGTTGLRIDERIRASKDLELLTLREEDRKKPDKRREIMQRADIIFLCLPDAAAIEAVELLEDSPARIIDASTAHRTHPQWTYGFPELGDAQYERIRTSGRVAVPGCHASGYIALTYPLVQAGLLRKDALLSCASLTGYSGGGKSMIAEYEQENRGEEYAAPRQYAMAQNHKHLKEMQHISGISTPPVFQPIVCGFYAGMAVSIPLHASMLAKKAGPQDNEAVFRTHYQNRPLVRVQSCMEETAFYHANAYRHLDCMEIMIAGNADRMTLQARYDNLGKGASGAAVQCMNIMLGRDEVETLHLG